VRLENKVAIVTGAGTGIGKAIAERFAQEGAAVVIDYVGKPDNAAQVVQQIEGAGGKALAVEADVSQQEQVQNLIEQTVQKFGRLDILVNNAGILRDKMSFNMDESDWDEVIRVHLKGHFAPTHHAAVYWRNRAKAGEEVTGRIINTSSEAGLFGNAGQINYSAAKAGIASMTWVLARELARYGVTANAIAPRARTRMTAGLFGNEFPLDDGSFDAWDPKNVANLVCFLAAPASADVTGQIFVVFGGNIYAMSAFRPIGQITRDGAWSPQELIEAKEELFKDIDSGVHPFGF
jgi:3-oxoacyl-[acyl-carrier protein] reductase